MREQEPWREPGLLEKAWNLTWGLVLVLGLTVLSEVGVHLGESKAPAAQPGFTVRGPAEPAGAVIK